MRTTALRSENCIHASITVHCCHALVNMSHGEPLVHGFLEMFTLGLSGSCAPGAWNGSHELLQCLKAGYLRVTDMICLGILYGMLSIRIYCKARVSIRISTDQLYTSAEYLLGVGLGPRPPSVLALASTSKRTGMWAPSPQTQIMVEKESFQMFSSS
jgi:hypothetical protein